MKKKRTTIVVCALLVVAVAAVAYPAYALWTAPAKDRPTLMYFRADL